MTKHPDFDVLLSQLASHSSCSAATVTNLKQLLNDSSTTTDENAIPQAVRNASRTISQAAPRRAVGRNKVSSKPASKNQTEEPPILSPEQQLTIATHTFNVSLKSLSDSAKEQDSKNSSKTTQQQPRKRTDHEEPSTTVTAKPLQPRSPNKSSARRRSSSTGSCINDISSFSALAECARIALGYIRRAKQKKGALNFQLEAGTISLIGKCLSLGAHSVALRELRLMHRRLHAHFDLQSTRKNDRKEELSEDKRILTECLDNRGYIPSDLETLGLVTTMGCYVVRLICTRKKAIEITQIHEYLTLDREDSLVKLLLLQAKRSPKSKDKVVRQLEVISNSILHCSSVLVSSSHPHQKQSTPPESLFSIQTLALTIRLYCFNLSGQAFQAESQFWAPLSKAILSYDKKCLNDGKIKYQHSTNTVNNLLHTLNSLGLGTNNESASFFQASVYRTLSKIGQEAGLFDFAIDWIQKAELIPHFRESSSARKGASTIRLTTLRLQQGPSEDILPQLDSAHSVLIGSLKGDADELDELLLEAAGLRRALVSVFMKEEESTGSGSALLRHCIVSIFGCARFLLRYLGPKPAQAQIPDARYTQRLQKTLKSTPSFIDSVILCGKKGIQLELVDWEDIDTVLLDCSLLIQRLSSPISSHSDNNILNVAKFRAKLSNVYWNYYIHNHSQGPSTRVSTIRALERSVVVLQNGCPEARRIGLVATKLEALASYHEKNGSFPKAIDSVKQLFRRHIESELVSTNAERSKSLSYDSIWLSAEASPLSRCIDRYHSIQSRGCCPNDSLIHCCEVELDQTARGFLLERELSLCCDEILKIKRQSIDEQLDNINTIVRDLLVVYNVDSYPIHRMRVLVVVSRLLASFKGMMPHDIVQIIEQMAGNHNSPMESKDDPLSSYLEFLHSSIIVNVELSKVNPSIGVLEKAIGIWHRLITDSQEIGNLIDHFALFRIQLTLLSDFLDVQCQPRLRLLVLAIESRMIELEGAKSVSSLIFRSSALGLQYLSLGYSFEAGKVLMRCHKLLEDENTSWEAKAQCHLACAEYYLQIEASSKSIQHLNAAATVVQDAEKTREFGNLGVSGNIKLNRMFAMAFEISSIHCLQNGRATDALRHLKRAVKLLQRTWMLLENSSPSIETEQSHTDVSIATTSQSNVQPVTSMTHDALNTARLWCIVPMLRRIYAQKTAVYTHFGMFSEALAWAEKAGKLIDATPSSSAILWHNTILADLWIKAGDVERGQGHLDQAAEEMQSEPSRELAQYHQTIAKMWAARGEIDDQIEALNEAMLVMDRLISQPSLIVSESPVEDDIVASLSKMSIVDAPASKAPRVKPRTRRAKQPVEQPSKPTSKKDNKVTKKPTGTNQLVKANTGAEVAPLHLVKGHLTVSKALALLCNEDISGAASLLESMSDHQLGSSVQSRRNVISCQVMIHEALKAMSMDCAFSTMVDSTVSIPSTAAERRESDQTIRPNASLRGKAKATKAGTTVKTAVKGNNRVVSVDFKGLLRDAQERLAENYISTVQLSSAADFRSTSRILLNAGFFVSAAVRPCSNPLTHPTYTALLLDDPSNSTQRRILDAAAISEEHIPKADLLKWPSISPDLSTGGTMSVSKFQETYIDVIPESWTAISLHLSENKDELCIGRYRAGESPFILRVPLASHTHSMDDDEKFGFDEGKEELLDIIEQSNITTRTSKYVDSKQARKDWWAERELLNTRMQNLLLNIEKIWIGGFKGIFTQQQHQRIFLTRFQKALQSILNRHLPSRKGKGKQKVINLDRRILELFVALGDPSNEDVDIDESVVDLLYFVVDILQFNGESNAYDEIDFDSLVIEILDALKAYHSASITADPSDHHTILILGNKLHCFPWESIPSLLNQNVSRLPSLEALRTRILAAKFNESLDGAACHIISKSKGTSLLNPSGDLKNTQLAIKPLLSSLPSTWVHLPPSKEPAEEQLEEVLTSNDIFLYFGHGSGNQYIRTRTVRSLKTPTPVAWLMGCSSAALTTHGEFEPEGMVSSYVYAGSPAIVGTLWDVTDKDCDRAAVKAGEAWGLWDTKNAGAEATKVLALQGRQKKDVREVETARGTGTGVRISKEKSKGKEPVRPKDDDHNEQKVNLVEAVRLGRQECYLSYLNGAALVVYGIPVMLSV